MKICKYILTVFWKSSHFTLPFDILSYFSTFFLEKNHIPPKEWRQIVISAWYGTHIKISLGRGKHESLQKERPATVTLCRSLHSLRLLPQRLHPQTQASGGCACLPASVPVFHRSLPHQVWSVLSVEKSTQNQNTKKKTTPLTGCTESPFLAIHFCSKAILLNKM